MDALTKFSKSIGNKIKFYRVDKNLSQEQLSERVDITQNYLSNIERGIRIPSLPVLVDIVDELGITPNDILVDVIKSSWQIKTRELEELLLGLTDQERNLVLDTMKYLVMRFKEK